MQKTNPGTSPGALLPTCSGTLARPGAVAATQALCRRFLLTGTSRLLRLSLLPSGVFVPGPIKHKASPPEAWWISCCLVWTQEKQSPWRWVQGIGLAGCREFEQQLWIPSAGLRACIVVRGK